MKHFTECPNNEIWYKTIDGEVLHDIEVKGFDAKLISNSYESGDGVLTFDADINVIGDDAFSWCKTLRAIIIPDSVKKIGTSAFMICPNLEFVRLSSTLLEIGSHAFVSCHNLDELYLPESLIEIGDSAFYSSGLKRAIIPNNVTKIGDSAFADCQDLEVVSIPKSVLEIGKDVFYEDMNIKYFRVLWEDPIDISGLGVETFNKNCELCIPENSVDKYNNAPIWTDFDCFVLEPQKK